MGQQVLNLKRFDPARMADSSTCVIIGKRNTGKSVLVKDLMYAKRHLPAGIVMSGTEEGNGYYGTWIPPAFVYTRFDPVAIERLYEKQKRLKTRGVKQNVYLLIDDCMFESNVVMKAPVIKELFMNGRHFNIFVILVAQYVMQLSPAVRSNSDYVIVLRDNIKENQERLHRAFFGMFARFDDFRDTMMAVTENYGALIIDANSRSSKIEDCVFWYKARVRDDFRMGAPQAWHFSSRRVDRRQRDHDKTDDKKKGVASKSSLIVRKRK